MHDLPPANQEKNHQDHVSLLRIIDAAANRTLEGLRVVEDAVRFGWDDRHLTERLKQSRHRIAATLAAPEFSDRLTCRDTLGDVGTDVRTQRESDRSGVNDILHANFARAQEGLRTLAECAKAIAPASVENFEQARYELYTLQKSVALMQRNGERMSHARVYVVVDGQTDTAAFEQTIRQLIEAQADVIQLRDKRLDDRTLLERARMLCDWIHDSSAPQRPLAIINDRADIAASAGADGVHVGQDELPVAAARSIVGADAMIGVSTHNIEQARHAVVEGADYLGVGPTFPSRTKSFDDFPGIAFIQQVAAEIAIPAFAIGGIRPDNVEQVRHAGIDRVAVSDAVLSATDPGGVLQALRAALTK